MLPKLLIAMTERFPLLKRWAWRRWYQYLAGYRVDNWSFMNYGYEPLDDDAKRPELEAEDENDRYCIQLYNHVAGAVDLSGLHVLEVGCGRGGGASFVKRYLHPQTMTAVDYSPKAIEFCQRKHQVDGLEFRHGDAESLPFEDDSFDAVLNVESSHCYGSMPAFLAQVKRVLRPGGYFLIADFRGSEEMDLLTKQLEQSGLRHIDDETITANVVKVLDIDDERKAALIGAHARRWAKRAFRQFAGMRGSAIYQGFQDGALIYKRFVYRK